jgi:hypothetical protein
MKTIPTKLTVLFLALALALPLAACASGRETTPSPSQSATVEPTSPTSPVETDPSPSPSADPEEAVRNYWKPEQLTQAWGPDQVVEHLFFHPVIAYPEFAFKTSDGKGLDDWMVTVDEYKKILNSLYEKGYILVPMESVWSEYTNESGETRMQRNTLMLPEGKKPLIFSFDDVNYYDYMLNEGFMSKLILGEDGDIWAYGVNPSTGEEVITQDLDATTILDKFVREHPDFSLNGAKGVFSLTGYQGILGYRTQNDIDIKAGDPARGAFDAKRQSEIDAVKPIIARLKETGWTFGSHTWGHIRLAATGESADARMKRDTLRWLEEVGSLVGPTQILFYPHGGRPDGDNDVTQTGPQFRWLQEQGFRIFASVGVESYSKIKTDISAVICDRLHPDGTTLRSGKERERYLKFYDAKDIIDLKNRPDLGVTW